MDNKTKKLETLYDQTLKNIRQYNLEQDPLIISILKDYQFKNEIPELKKAIATFSYALKNLYNYKQLVITKLLQEALTVFITCFNSDKKYEQLAYCIGSIYFELNNYYFAVMYFDKYYIKHFSSLNTLFKRSIALIFLKDYEKSLHDLNLVLKLNYKHLPAFLYRGIIYTKTDKLYLAVKDFDTFLERDPDNEFALNYKIHAVNLITPEYKVKMRYPLLKGEAFTSIFDLS